MKSLQTHIFSFGRDNYGLLLHAPATGETACIDAGDAQATRLALQETGWNLTHILITHHHGDHTAGLSALKQQYACDVVGPSQHAQTPGVDRRYQDGDQFTFADVSVKVIATPGHTLDMINYYFPSQDIVFTGDTLFALGCGRVFEGTMKMMWESLQKLMALPPQTTVYFGHEYTEANAAFALTIDPDNSQLCQRVEQVKAWRKSGKMTIPTTIGLELATNPFLRVGDDDIRRRLGKKDAADEEVFGEIRRRKDRF